MPTIAATATTKSCSKCHEEKALSEFQKDSTRKDGLCRQCKSCKNASRSAHSKANRRAENKRKAAYLRGAGAHIQWEKHYRERANRFGFPPHIVRFTKEELIARHGDSCVDCDGAFEELEHVVPVSQGGEHSLENCRPICREDNRRRWDERDSTEPLLEVA